MQLPGAPQPIDPLLPELCAALARAGRAVLQAPPGAGKTTRVPLALMGRVPGRIVMLEPRRLAARAAAERLAETLGETVGARVGYRIRGEAQVGRETVIEVVTEGILTRMLQDDPSLDGVGALIFDEFHERSLNADLGLAMALEARAALRPDLWLLVMSATLDAAPVAELMGGAPLLSAEGRAFPVETRWLERPLPPKARLEREMADLILRALGESEGGVLAFLPGEGEIRRTMAALGGRLPADVVLQPLYGALPFTEQRAAIAPLEKGRKLVLATAIAETSLTIADIRVVVDAGRARRARFDPGSGMTRLVTEPVSRAEAEQRRGRAGRVAPGLCFRLWARVQEGALPAHPPAEIESADLAGLALELALWGGDNLPFLTPPPEVALEEARALLAGLGALDSQWRITGHGREMALLPLHPRLAHMLLVAGKGAAPLAALMAERDPLIGAPADLSLRLRALKDPRDAPFPIRREALERIRAEAKRLARRAPADKGFSPAEAAALAYPDRIGQRRPGEAPRYLLSGGKGAYFDDGEPLGQAPMVVATDLDGDRREARIRQALALTQSALRGLFAGQIRQEHVCEWGARQGRVLSREREMFGALVLAERRWSAPPEMQVRAALDGLRVLGLDHSLNPAARRLQARVDFLRKQGADLPDISDEALMARAEEWLMPFLSGVRSAEDLRARDLTPALEVALGYEGRALADKLAPSHFTTPTGRRVAIDYAGGQPAIFLRLQEMFGVAEHPVSGPQRLPLKITLLSPAQRPLAVTTDLPGFWAGAYGEVRKEMRGRYPRHPWPEDPLAAAPTLRVKPRGK
ncbi:MAG: ATP-dependent helicase HrpB [Pararhodobacter sp.]|nr:ATP-dependent helicase HrpB [Pararhodobacter sp.]